MIEWGAPVRVFHLFFGYLTRAVGDQYETLHQDIRAARMATTFHSYLARTMLYALATFVGVLSLLAVAVAIYLHQGLPPITDQLLLIAGMVVAAVTASYIVYRGRLYYPRYVADGRARASELSMPTVVNFLLALSRAGVPPRAVLELIADQVDVLGEAANEFKYAWRDMEYFGADVVSALGFLSATTPLESFAEFTNGYARALTGQGEADAYLQDQMQALFEKAELKQDDFLSRLGVLAEVYVALFVAFPIFMMIILVVMGFIGTAGVQVGLQLVVYVVVPVAAIGFLVLLEIVMSHPLGSTGGHRSFSPMVFEDPTRDIPIRERDNPEDASNAQKLARYQMKRRLERFLQDPLTSLRRNPRYALYVGSALGIGYLGGKVILGWFLPDNPILPAIRPAVDPGSGIDVDVLVRAIDASVVEALIIVLAVYGIFYESRARYLREVEEELAAFLRELAQRHQVGMSLSGSIRALRTQDLGRMDEEIQRMVRDLRLQTPVHETLKRFANRVRSPVVTRVVVLLTAASEAAERLDPVVESLGRWAEQTNRLREERQVEMMLYVIVIYLAYFVFVFILVILNDVFLPQVPTGAIEFGSISANAEFEPTGFQTLFFHMSVIQAVFSGLVGGKMSTGRISGGVKHAFVMLVVSYLVFVVLLPAITIEF